MCVFRYWVLDEMKLCVCKGLRWFHPSNRLHQEIKATAIQHWLIGTLLEKTIDGSVHIAECGHQG